MSQFKHNIGPDTRITFPDKPCEAVRALLKGAGFRWSPAGGFWWRRGCKGAAEFIAALDRKLNPGRPDGACWRCNSPEGFFRPQGAATPVYCDACFALAKAGKGPRGESDGLFDRGTDKPAHTCAGMHDVSCDACHADRFDLDYEDRCREACGL